MKLSTSLLTRRNVVGSLIGLVLLGSCVAYWTPPSDASVRQRFEAHAADYERLVAMLEADKQVETLGTGFEFAVGKRYLRATLDDLGITQARLDEYRSVMKRAEVGRVDRFEDGSIYFMVWATGGMDTTRHKSVVYFPASPPTDTQWDFVPIRGRWYIGGE